MEDLGVEDVGWKGIGEFKDGCLERCVLSLSMGLTRYSGKRRG